MSFSNCNDVETFTITYRYPNEYDLLEKYSRKFNNLKIGLRFIFALKIAAKKETNTEFGYIKVFNGKKKIIEGNIEDIYELYLKTYSKATKISLEHMNDKFEEMNIAVDDGMFDIIKNINDRY